MKKWICLLVALMLALPGTAALAEEGAAELKNYVEVIGIKAAEGKKYETFTEAYQELRDAVASVAKPADGSSDGLGQESPLTLQAFDEMFTERDENGDAKITYKIHGTMVYDEKDCPNLLTMGRKASHYNKDQNRHLIKFEFIGADENRGATLMVNSNITLPYEWWGGENKTTYISFENLTLSGSAPSGIYATQAYFQGLGQHRITGL